MATRKKVVMSDTNPFQGMIDFYNDSVAEADQKGYAEIYKAITEQILYHSIPEAFIEIEGEGTFTVTDLEYLDGYFLFGKGTNSVVEFKIKENPEWLFGIWYSIKEDELYQGLPLIKVQMFAQYEEEIDKFKPSASVFCDSFCTNGKLEDLDAGICWDFARQIIFIIKEPALAYCRDVFYWDYNLEYHTREEAEEVQRNDKAHKLLTEQYQHNADQAIEHYVLSSFSYKPNEMPNGCIFKRDENWSPRYDIFFFVEPDHPDIKDRYDAHYKTLIEDNVDEEFTNFLKGYGELKEKLVAEAPEDVYYDSNWSNWITIVNYAWFQEHLADCDNIILF